MATSSSKDQPSLEETLCTIADLMQRIRDTISTLDNSAQNGSIMQAADELEEIANRYLDISDYLRASHKYN